MTLVFGLLIILGVLLGFLGFRRDRGDFIVCGVLFVVASFAVSLYADLLRTAATTPPKPAHVVAMEQALANVHQGDIVELRGGQLRLVYMPRSPEEFRCYRTEEVPLLQPTRCYGGLMAPHTKQVYRKGDPRYDKMARRFVEQMLPHS